MLKNFAHLNLCVLSSIIHLNCFAEMGVMPEIGRAVEEMDWR